MRRAAPFLPLPGLAVSTDCARSIWSPIPISIPAKGHIGGRSELNGGLRVITSVAAIDPASNESPEWAVSAGVFWGAMQEQPVPRVGCRITFENLSQRTTTSGKSGKCARGRGPQKKDSTSVHQRSLHALPLWNHLLKENPLFPLRGRLRLVGEG